MKDNRVNAVLSLLPSGKTVLDIGCAQNPFIHKEIVKRSRYVVGIDINEKGIKSLKKQGFEAYVMNAENISLARTFEYVIAGELIEHLNNAGLFFESILKHLTPKGKIILTTPNISSILLFILVVLFDKTQDPTHVYYFDKKNLESLINRFKLVIDEYKYIPPEIKLHGKGVFFRIIFLLATLIANVGFKFNQRLFGSYLLVVLKKEK